jgi:hypothetical protein
MKPLAIDLFCGLGGWAEGFLAEGYDVIGFDNERHRYPVFERENVTSEEGVKAPGNDTFKVNGKPCNKLTDSRYGSGKRPESRGDVVGWREYPGQLVLQDVLTLHGSQFRNAAVIVASPPCQEYSYRAMPWKRTKALPPPSNELFDACFRIQREANYAAGHECHHCFGGGRQGHFRPCLYCNGEGWIYGNIPMVVENVRGAEKWVGAARWHFGSYYLWGDVPPLMPITMKATKVPGFRFDGSGRSFQTASVEAGRKVPGISWSGSDKPGYKAKGLNVEAARRLREGVKNGAGSSVVDRGHEPSGGVDRLLDAESYQGRVPAARGISDRAGEDSFGWSKNSPLRNNNSRSDSRKQASAEIAKIPFPLAHHIARVFKP